MTGPAAHAPIDCDGLGDDALLALARDGRPEAFRAIMQHANQRLFRMARAVMRDDDEAEDVLQESYLRAFTNLARFRGESSLLTWLTTIVLNEARGRLRRRKPMVELDQVDAAWQYGGVLVQFPSGGAVDPELMAGRGQMRRMIERAIDDLPENFRVVFMMRAIEGCSIDEAAAQLGVKPETIKTRLHRARRLLRLALEREIASTIDDAFAFLGPRCETLTANVLRRMFGDTPQGRPAPDA